MAWLRSHGNDPIVEATLAKFYPVNDMPPSYDAWVNGGNVEINGTGNFFTSENSRLQQLILLHETAHLTEVIVPERGSWVQTQANNDEIRKHCSKALGLN